MTPTFTLARRYLLRRKMRSVLTTLAIVFGVALVIGVDALIPAMEAALEDGIRSSLGAVDMSVSKKARTPFDAAQLQAVRDVPGVARASARLTSSLQFAEDPPLVIDKKPVLSAVVVGVDTAEERPALPLDIKSGDALRPGQTAVLVSAPLVEKAGLKLGGTLTLPTATGAVSARVAGTVAAAPGGGQTVVMPLALAQAVTGRTGATEMHVVFDKGADPEATKAAVLGVLGDTFHAEIASSNQQLIDTMKQMRAPMLGFGVMALVMAGFIIFITFRTVVVERRRDLGLLRALGATRRGVLAMVMTEGLLQGIVGTVVGMGLGFALSRGLIAAMSPVVEGQMGITLRPVPVAPGTWVVAASLGVLASLFSALLPALSASRVSPVQSMRVGVSHADKDTGLPRAIAGVVLGLLALGTLPTGHTGLQAVGMLGFGAALMLLGPVVIGPVTRMTAKATAIALATEGRVATGNIARHKRRSAITAAVMMMGLAAFVGLSGSAAVGIEGMMGSIERNMGADYLVSRGPASFVSADAVGVDSTIVDQVKTTPGIAAASGVRLFSGMVDGASVQLVGLEPDAYQTVGGSLTVTEGSAKDALAKLKTGRTFIAGSQWKGKHPAAKVGDTFDVQTKDGPRAYTLVAFGDDALQFRVLSVYISAANISADFGQNQSALVMAKATDGADHDTVTAALTSALKDQPGISVMGVGAWKDKMMQDVGKKMNAMYMLLFLIMGPALLGLANTLGINVLERIRELGLMRAVGSTRRQVRRVVIAEGLLLSVVGAAFGVVLGLWLTVLYVGLVKSMGMASDFVFPTAGILTAIVVGVVFGALAALFPARHAAGLKIVTALRHS